MSTGTGLAHWTPTHAGYQLVNYLDGSTALVAWDPVKGWEWGSTTPPASEVIFVRNLGTKPFADAAAFGQAIKPLPTKVREAFTRIASESGLSHPTGAILVNGQGGIVNKQPVGGDTSQAPWTAKTLPGESGGNTDPLLPSLPSLGGLAVRVLEAVGGVLLLVIALRALLGGPSPTEVIAATARRVA